MLWIDSDAEMDDPDKIHGEPEVEDLLLRSASIHKNGTGKITKVEMIWKYTTLDRIRNGITISEAGPIEYPAEFTRKVSEYDDVNQLVEDTVVMRNSNYYMENSKIIGLIENNYGFNQTEITFIDD